jgi:NYN domain-containing protein
LAEDSCIRSALFVDFDNVYIGLRGLDTEAAERFAADPGKWLQWMEDGMPGPGGADLADLRDRRILIRRCYLNPVAFSRYRPFFIRAGFSVVDCPPLTGQGKTSTDIHMVMDILDTLQQYEHIEEFIVLSGDADFTPVLLRLRARDRRTTALTVGPAAAAYRAASDRVLTENDFVEVALGVEAQIGDWSDGEAGTGAEPAADGLDLAELRQSMLDEVRRIIDASEEPLPLARAAHSLRKQFGRRVEETGWAGAGSFKALLRSDVGPGLEVTEGAPGYVFDPNRHEPPLARAIDARIAEFGPELGELVARVHNVTGAPALTSRQYARIFESLSEQLLQEPYQLTATSKAVRDRCVEAGEPISRQEINFVLKGIAYRQGFAPTAPSDPRSLAVAFAENVLGLTSAAQLELTEGERSRVTAWIGGVQEQGARAEPGLTVLPAQDG